MPESFEVPTRIGEIMPGVPIEDVRRVQIERELTAIEKYFSKPLPPIDSLAEWQKQTNPGLDLSHQSGGTCALASTANVLRSLGLYDSAIHTEENFIDLLGGEEFLNKTRGGAGHEEIAFIISQTAPTVKIKGSVSAYEILRAIENGGAAVVSIGASHAGAIYPGSRLARDENGSLEVQVVDPAKGVRMIPVRDLIKYQLGIAYPPSAYGSTIVDKP